jgi:uncharacterized membrane protein YgcG
LTCVAIFLTSLSAIPQRARAEEKGEPQMVWLSYAEGEVKFSPGHKGQPKLGKDWIEANRGQVMENGYTLVTEKGRAEIEFEDRTVVYLAENSALEFAWLWAQANKNRTETELNLLTGMATIMHPSVDWLDLDTPAVRLSFMHAHMTRVECALDGVVIKEFEEADTILSNAGITKVNAGESVAIAGGKVTRLKGMEQPGEDEELNEWAVRTVRQPEFVGNEASNGWDQWVEERVATRRALVAEGLRESGLTEPIPGLMGMMEGGRFFDCLQGKCWKANGAMRQAGANGFVGQAEPMTAAATNDRAQMAMPESLSETDRTPQRPTIVVNQAMLTRCPMEAWQVTAGGTVMQYGTCLAGSWNDPRWDSKGPCRRWDPARNMYVYWRRCDVYPTWVVGRRHYRHECHLVKVGHHEIGILPRHPLESRGKPLVNAKSGILVLAVEKGQVQARVQPVSSKGVHTVGSVPRGIERELMESAPRVMAPVIEAKMVEAILPRGVLGAGHAAGQTNVTVIRLDMKTGNFLGRSSDAGGGSRAVSVGHVGGGGGASGGGSHGGSGGGGASSGGGDTRAEDRQEERRGVVEVVVDIIEWIQRGCLVIVQEQRGKIGARRGSP